MKLLFATHNEHKVQEIRAILGDKVQVVSLADLGDFEEIPETGETLEENALIKARTAFARHKLPCFADDTGLEVCSLGGEPGVRSARYAGEEHNSARNRAKLLHELAAQDDRKARFRTVVALIYRDEEHLFEGEVRGEISDKEEGNSGFGYDSIFRPEGFKDTFAGMDPEEKNRISHRARAIQSLATFLDHQLQ